MAIGYRDQRKEPRDGLDDYPTPPWAVEALIERNMIRKGSTILEPCANRGYLSNTLSRHHKSEFKVTCSDIHDYGLPNCEIVDYLSDHYEPGSFDWVVTNPPFTLAEQFIEKSLKIATQGVAIFARIGLLEGISRYENIYKFTRPRYVLPFSERVHISKGEMKRKTNSGMFFSWYVWKRHPRFAYINNETSIRWISPGVKRRLEKDEDYEPLSYIGENENEK